MINELQQLGIELKGRTRGEYKTTCPQCSKSRKNSKDPCLSVNIDEGVFNCHNCGWSGTVKKYEKKKEYVKPPARLEKLKPATIEYFDKRGISNNTTLKFGITESLEWLPKAQAEIPAICFNYFRDGQLINIKYRGKNKDFKMVANAELIFYNLDAIKGCEEAVIVEGEIDALTLDECGIHNVVSVPNGASNGNLKLEYLDNCWREFDGKKIVLITDNDEPGIRLQEELARRFGKERCYKVQWPEGCKDANEVLLKYNKEGVKALYDSKFQWPLEGILTMDEMFDEVVQFYEQGYPKGIKTYVPGLDDFLQLMYGQFTVVTGSPGSGKSEFIDQIIANTTKMYGTPWAVFSYENQPSSLHVTKIMEKISGKAFGARINPDDRLNQREFEYAIGIIDACVNFININKSDITLDGILSKIKELVERKGVKFALLDPWNCIEHNIPPNMSETQYISLCLSKITVFCKTNGIHLFLVAHPTKLKKDEKGYYEVATLYQISGSAHFFNKCDNGVSIWRDFKTSKVEIHVQKVRYSWLGKVGMIPLNYNIVTRQYQTV